jgi:hypothetical protein
MPHPQHIAGSRVSQAPRGDRRLTDVDGAWPGVGPTRAGSTGAARLSALVRAVAIAGVLGLCAVLLPAAASAATGSISGVVKEGEPKFEAIAGVEVCAFEAAVETKRGCTLTNSSGEYKIEGLAEASYKVRFTATNFVTKWYNEKISFSTADSVEVKSSEPGLSENINASLREEQGFGLVTGRVINASNGQGASGVEVCPRAGTPCAETNSNGEYKLSGVHSGLEEIYLNPAQECEEEQGEKTNRCYLKSNYISQSVSVRVRTSKTEPANTVGMQSGGQISGAVTNASITHPGLAKVRVCATKVQGTAHEYEEYEDESCSVTNSGGQYTISGLETGVYKVEFDGEICLIPQAKRRECSETYVTRYYHGKSTHRQAETIPVTTGSNTGAINESLYEGFPTTPTSTAAPTLTGTAAVGQTLTCSQGSWAHEPTYLLYQWTRNGTVITGQTGSTYVLQAADQGHSITCTVTAGNGAGAVTVNSNAVAIPVPLALFVGVKVKGSVASVTLRCPGPGACSGVMRIVARVTTRQGRRRHTSNVTIGVASFSMAAGRRVTLRVLLTGQGRKLLGRAGRRGLRVQIAGSGVQAHAALLRPVLKRRR